MDCVRGWGFKDTLSLVLGTDAIRRGIVAAIQYQKKLWGCHHQTYQDTVVRKDH